MKLEFGILWFEDQPADIQADITRLERKIKDLGFQPRIDFYPNMDEIEAISEKQASWHVYELVAVDYHLDGVKGDEVAKQIRTLFPFTRILFYSSQTKQQLLDIITRAGVEGVFCENRERLADTLMDFIQDLVAGVDRLESMRGLAAATIGRCDELLRESLLKLGNLNPNEAEAICKKIAEKVRNGNKQNLRSLEKYRTNLSELLKSRCVTSAHLYMAVSSRLKALNIAKGEREALNGYQNDALKPRNTLGHAVEVENGPGGWEIADQSGGNLKKTDFPKIRKDLFTHLRNMEAIRSAILSHVDSQPPNN